MEKQTPTRSAKRSVLLPMAMMLILGNQLVASTGSESITAGEILMYIALIAGVILAAWFLSSGQSKGSNSNSNTTTTNPPNSNAANHRHYFEHPNDPHFRRLRKRA